MRRDQREPQRRREGRRFIPRRKVCIFCVDHVRHIDYKDVGRLNRYLSDRAKIERSRKTGTCAKHQRGLALAIKRARHLSMLPFIPSYVQSFIPERIKVIEQEVIAEVEVPVEVEKEVVTEVEVPVEVEKEVVTEVEVEKIIEGDKPS